MSQHLIKEIHQLKHEIQQLKEGVTPGQLLSEVQGRLEHIEKKLGIGEHDWLGQPAGVRAKGPRIWRGAHPQDED